MNTLRITFVCLANICRSPTAESVLTQRAVELGIPHLILAASAGTSNVRLGQPADSKATRIAAKSGYTLGKHIARTISDDIAKNTDYIIAVDTYNLLELKEVLPKQHHSKIHLLLDFTERYERLDIPDPYKRSTKAYRQALELIEQGVEGLIQHLRMTHKF